jgi:hypothetical protein
MAQNINLMAALAALAGAVAGIPETFPVMEHRVKETMGAMVKLNHPARAAVEVNHLLVEASPALTAQMVVQRPLQAFLALALQLLVAAGAAGKVLAVLAAAAARGMVAGKLLSEVARLQILVLAGAVAALTTPLVATAVPALSSFAIFTSKVKHGSFC